MTQSHKWSIVSTAITTGTPVAIGSYVQYQNHIHHVTAFNVTPVIGICSVLTSVATGLVAGLVPDVITTSASQRTE